MLKKVWFAGMLAVTVLLSALILNFSSCKKDENKCQVCADTTSITSFTGEYFRYIKVQDNIVLIKYDSTTGAGTFNSFCPFAGFDAVENNTILKITGSTVSSCDGGQNTIKVKSFQKIQNCPSTIPDLNGPYSLLTSQWKTVFVQVGANLYFPPCEGMTSQLSFLGSPTRIYLDMSLNTIQAPYQLLGSDSLALANVTSTGNFGNTAETTFDVQFEKVFVKEAHIQYIVLKNQLTIVNPKTGASARFYTQ